jgi:hypothetical protein
MAQQVHTSYLPTTTSRTWKGMSPIMPIKRVIRTTSICR